MRRRKKNKNQKPKCCKITDSQKNGNKSKKQKTKNGSDVGPCHTCERPRQRGPPDTSADRRHVTRPAGPPYAPRQPGTLRGRRPRQRSRHVSPCPFPAQLASNESVFLFTLYG
jgi:hypothetical protein